MDTLSRTLRHSSCPVALQPRVEVVPVQNGENLFRGPEQIIGLALRLVGAGEGLSHAKRVPMVNAATIRSSTDKFLRRASSRSRERVAHSLRRGPRIGTAGVVCE